MNKPEIIAIAALGKETKNICHEEKLLWTNPKDLKRVKEETLGYPLIMGRVTHDSIGRALPNRTNIVMTNNQTYMANGCEVAHSADEALNIAKKSPGGSEKIFIFGGSEIYKLFLNQTDTLMLTLVNSSKHGTHQFPDFEDDFIENKSHGSHEFEDDIYEWVDYTRK